MGLSQLNTCVGKNVGEGPFSEIPASKATERRPCMLGSLSPKESGISVSFTYVRVYIYAQLVNKYECPRNTIGYIQVYICISAVTTNATASTAVVLWLPLLPLVLVLSHQ